MNECEHHRVEAFNTCGVWNLIPRKIEGIRPPQMQFKAFRNVFTYTLHA